MNLTRYPDSIRIHRSSDLAARHFPSDQAPLFSSLPRVTLPENTLFPPFPSPSALANNCALPKGSTDPSIPNRDPRGSSSTSKSGFYFADANEQWGAAARDTVPQSQPKMPNHANPGRGSSTRISASRVCVALLAFRFMPHEYTVSRGSPDATLISRYVTLPIAPLPQQYFNFPIIAHRSSSSSSSSSSSDRLSRVPVFEHAFPFPAISASPFLPFLSPRRFIFFFFFLRV